MVHLILERKKEKTSSQCFEISHRRDDRRKTRKKKTQSSKKCVLETI